MSAHIERLFAIAMTHHRAGRLDEAERAYRQILDLEPRHADALHLLGVLAHQSGRHALACDLIREAIARNSSTPSFHNNLGNALKARGALAEAADAYRQALAIKPDYPEAHYNLGVTLHAKGDVEEAVESFRRALSLRANHPQSHYALANALASRGALEEAIACYQRALGLRPGYVDAWTNLGNALQAAGRLEEAVDAYGHALTVKPGLAEAHHNLGIAMLRLGRPAEALASCRQAVQSRPDYAQAHCSLGHALRENGDSEAALASYRRALELDSDCAEARLGLTVAAIPIICDTVGQSESAAGEFMRSLDELAAWSQSHPGRLGPLIGVVQPFHLPYGHRDVTTALSRYGTLACREIAGCCPQIDLLRAAAPDRKRIRMVVVSGHVREHPVWRVISRGLLANIDRGRLETIVYHTGALADEQTAWAARHADRFVQGPKPLASWLQELARDRPDVIFYPEVGMDPLTCALAALRLAPVQVAAWGHPVTTGMPSIDLFVSGELLEPPGAEQHYCETLVRLPGTGVFTEASDTPARHWDGPGRRAGVVRFALCQQPIKLDPADDALLARIARTASPCELWLAAPKNLPWAMSRVRERLSGALRREGLDPGQCLKVTDWLPRERFLSFLEAMDVSLDSPAFSGYTTAWEAVHRGLPVLTLAGPFLRQRLAAGLLAQIGLTEGIAHSPAQYLGTAVRWAQEARSARWPVRREALRRAAPLADGNRLAVRAFEDALAEAVSAAARKDRA